MKNTTAIITAAGSGTRLPGTAKKQFRELGGIPILIRSAAAFFATPAINSIIITSPEEDVSASEALIKQYFEPADKPWIVIPGGIERQDSVFNALQYCQKDTDMVAIHDGVRPFVTDETILQLLTACQVDQAVVPAIKLKNTVKEIEGDYAITTLNRSQLIQVLTPQVFDYQLIMSAYLQAYEDTFFSTDDASLVERLGIRVRYLYCSELNFKITDELDLFLATQLLEKNMI